MPDEILTERKDGVLQVTLNRPDKLNQITPGMWSGLMKAFDLADEDDDVRAVILTGAGKMFCAGLDISAGASAFNRSETPGKLRRGEGGILVLRMFECKKPIIAAFNGTAVGVGVTMTLAADIRIAAQSAKFSFVFNKRGIVPEACSNWFLPRIVGIQQALAWTYSGKTFPADEALRGGLLLETVPDEQLLARAHELAKEIAVNAAPLSVVLNRQMMWKLLGADHPMEAHKLEARAMASLSRSADAKEGVAAFLEKRPANFSMKPSRDMPEFYPWWTEREFE